MATQREKLMPVVRDLRDFDRNSGNWLERLIFNHRGWTIVITALLSLILAGFATRLVINTSFDRMIPQSHPYIQNYFNNKTELRGLGNSVRVVVENTQGDIFDAEYIDVLKKVNDALYLLPGVERAWMKSIVMPTVRWTEVTEDGYADGPVLPAAFDGSPKALSQLRENIARAKVTGSLVAKNHKSSMIVVPLLDRTPETGQRLDYGAFSGILERDIRQKYELAKTLEHQLRAHETGKIKIHIVGFAKLVGDLIDGLRQVVAYFAAAALITMALLFFYTRDWRSTLLVILSSLLAVVWQLGLIKLLGYELDPYSILVPFLVFSIGVSHGTQKMNGIMQDVGRGTHKYVAARYTFRRLFLAGLTALLTNVIGFAVLMVIDIPVIKDLAITASVGVATLVVTKLILVPVLLSYIGVSEKAAARSLMESSQENQGTTMGGKLVNFAVRFTTRPYAIAAVATASMLFVGAFVVSLQVKTGDLDAGAPELRPDSRYNRDMAFTNANFGLSSDQFAVIVKTASGQCDQYQTLVETDRLVWALKQLPSVQTTTSLAESARTGISGGNEGDPKWLTISRNQALIDPAVARTLYINPGLANPDCSVTPVVAYLTDHKAETLAEVVRTVEAFAREHNTEQRQFLLAAGSAGVEAVTNMVVTKANRTILWLVYASVVACCLLTFRNWRAVIVALIPLIITSFLCEAIMVALGIGIKVATLPVIALGVGVGVDYALYLLSVQLALQRQGKTLTEAYAGAVHFTGKVVCLIGVTMAAGVITWAWSPIKFQADMGVLLAFMFVWNMVGALLLIPALSYFLLRPASEKTGNIGTRNGGPEHARHPSSMTASAQLASQEQERDASFASTRK